MAFDIRASERCDSYMLENSHPKKLHFENGVPIFSGRSKHVVKTVHFKTAECKECGATCRYDHRGYKACEDECGGFYDNEPRLSYQSLIAERIQ